jgi:hypothetical protein
VIGLGAAIAWSWGLHDGKYLFAATGGALVVVGLELSILEIRIARPALSRFSARRPILWTG